MSGRDAIQGDRPSSAGRAHQHFKPFSAKAFAAAWADESLRRPQIAAMFGISNLHCWRRAKALGLPPRRQGPPRKATPDAFIKAAWLAGVGSRAICRAAGIDDETLYSRVREMGLPLRGPGKRPKMTLADFREVQLRDAMAISAAETRAHMKLAEMVDGVRRAA